MSVLKTSNLQSATGAVLIRDYPYPPVWITSGFSKNTAKQEGLIHNYSGTKAVLAVAKHLNFNLPTSVFDNHRKSGYSPCSYRAGHVEMKSMVYFIMNHCFPTFGYQNDHAVSLLERIQPGNRLRSATIHLDHSPCKVCEAFKVLLETTYDVQFTFEEMRKTIGIQGTNTNYEAVWQNGRRMTGQQRKVTNAQIRNHTMAARKRDGRQVDHNVSRQTAYIASPPPTSQCKAPEFPSRKKAQLQSDPPPLQTGYLLSSTTKRATPKRIMTRQRHRHNLQAPSTSSQASSRSSDSEEWQFTPPGTPKNSPTIQVTRLLRSRQTPNTTPTWRGKLRSASRKN